MHLFPFHLGLGRRGPLLVVRGGGSRLARSSARASSPDLLASPTARLSALTSARSDFGPGQAGPMGHVGREHGIHLGRLDATASQRRLDPVGIFAQHADIDHACSK